MNIDLHWVPIGRTVQRGGDAAKFSEPTPFLHNVDMPDLPPTTPHLIANS
ncbi:hypothetical protein [Methylomonas lenta]|nr:hypothetical protein [Methylomonas lenta]